YRDGPATLAHGNRGRTPANRLDDAQRARLVELATTTYAGVNRAHLAELLAEREGIVVAERTLRRILAEASVRPTRTRRPPRHRSRRERMPREGQLLRTDRGPDALRGRTGRPHRRPRLIRRGARTTRSRAAGRASSARCDRRR
ncbi:MAG: helix-turn-helix domain-containing protein, partial [Candidatus Limnocylindrales bacterium]